jgi:hypothetical protein
MSRRRFEIGGGFRLPGNEVRRFAPRYPFRPMIDDEAAEGTTASTAFAASVAIAEPAASASEIASPYTVTAS